jgi:tRNA dimethylallyltransferase
LARLDAAAAARIHPNDLNKSIRALELRLLAGRTTAEHFAGAGLEPLTGYETLILAPDPPRDELYKMLDARCEAMWAGGLLEEVRALLAAGVPVTAKPFEALGYKQALRVVLDPALPHGPALEEMKIRTRQYAKRQWTWFRAEKDVQWLPGFGSTPAAQHAAFEMVSAFLEKFC